MGSYKKFEFEGTTVLFENVSSFGENLVSSSSPSIAINKLKESLTPIIKFGKTIIDEASEKISPDEIELSFGMDLSVESGNICWGIAKGSSETHFNITMKWEKSKGR